MPSAKVRCSRDYKNPHKSRIPSSSSILKQGLWNLVAIRFQLASHTFAISVLGVLRRHHLSPGGLALERLPHEVDQKQIARQPFFRAGHIRGYMHHPSFDPRAARRAVSDQRQIQILARNRSDDSARSPATWDRPYDPWTPCAKPRASSRQSLPEPPNVHVRLHRRLAYRVQADLDFPLAGIGVIVATRPVAERIIHPAC